MRSPGHATVWGTHIGIGRARGGAGWFQQLKDWWQAHKTARQQAKLAALNARWNAEREVIRPLRTESAAEMVAAEHAFSTAIALYGLSV
ncbi:MAG TPA: hypothetical protein VLK82_17610 [Candidatus Tectomicrobia bacterium]|nr:hypothetical protein [Candidatus Tectomicrobia bacterium]